MSSFNLLPRLPSWISRWLGYRSTPPTKQQEYIISLWSFLGAFLGLAIVQAVFEHTKAFTSRNVPSIIASYGASAVLCYATIDSPLAQPRSLIGGHFISALSGLCITKLFALLPSQRYDSLRWLAGSLSTAVAIVLMQITKTIHPPAGATALLVAVDRDVEELSWYYLPVILLSSTLVLVTALMFNNIQRRYPVFWIEPAAAAVTRPSSPLISSHESKKNSGEIDPASLV